MSQVDYFWREISELLELLEKVNDSYFHISIKEDIPAVVIHPRLSIITQPILSE